jgi:hypothetical protein
MVVDGEDPDGGGGFRGGHGVTTVSQRDSRVARVLTRVLWRAHLNPAARTPPDGAHPVVT